MLDALLRLLSEPEQESPNSAEVYDAALKATCAIMSTESQLLIMHALDSEFDILATFNKILTRHEAQGLHSSTEQKERKALVMRAVADIACQD